QSRYLRAARFLFVFSIYQLLLSYYMFFFFSSRRRHTRFKCDWSSDVCSSDLDWPASLRRSAVSNASRSAAVSTTKETSEGNAAPPRWTLRIGTMISAASSTVRLPAPVPIGGTVTVPNSHSCTCCSAERHARATP